LIPTVLRLLLEFLSLKNDVNLSYPVLTVPLKSNKQKNFFKISLLLDVGVLKVSGENSRIQIRILEDGRVVL
jgi:hypothetical protein